MEIIIEPHTIERAHERGATKNEIYDVISHGIDIPAKSNRYGNIKYFLLIRKEMAVFTSRSGLRFITS